MVARTAAVAATIALCALLQLSTAPGGSSAATRVTVFGDSAATAMAYDPDARRTLVGASTPASSSPPAAASVTRAARTTVSGLPTSSSERPSLGASSDRSWWSSSATTTTRRTTPGTSSRLYPSSPRPASSGSSGLTLRESRQSYASMNDMIRDAARRHPELTVVDWNALSRNNPPWLQSDDIHLTAIGAEAMADLLNGTLVQLGIAPKPTPPPSRRLLAIASRALPAGRPGRRLQRALKAVGRHVPYRWARIAWGLPPGLRLASTGRLSGVPARKGDFHRAGTSRGPFRHRADAGLLAADLVEQAPCRAEGLWLAAPQTQAQSRQHCRSERRARAVGVAFTISEPLAATHRRRARRKGREWS